MDATSDREYVGFWARFWACVVDSALYVLIAAPVLTSIYGSDHFYHPHAFADSPNFLISQLAPAIIIIVFWRAKGATPGKMVIGARIVDAGTGLPPSLSQCIGRYLGYIVSSIPLFLGFFWIGFDARKQGWHDKLAGTVVVRSRPRGRQSVQFTLPGTPSSAPDTGSRRGIVLGLLAIAALWAFALLIHHIRHNESPEGQQIYFRHGPFLPKSSPVEPYAGSA